MIDLAKQEQDHVRVALRFLRARARTWAILGKALGFGESSLANVASGVRPATPTVAFRVAKFAKVGVDDVLAGRFPPKGACPHCGHIETEITK